LIKIGGYIIAYNEEAVILGAMREAAENIIVAISTEPYYGPTDPPDRTEAIALDNGCTVIKGNWRKEKDQRNACVERLQDCDLIISGEADMWWESHHLTRMLQWFYRSEGRACRVKQHGYWFDTNHRFLNDPYNPVVAIKPGVSFVHIANPSCETVLCPEAHCHHLAWAYPKDIKKKVQTYSHAHQIPAHWYEENFKLSTRVKMPDCELEVIETEFPEELKVYVKS
jgi:hypothetical protein